VGGTLALSNLQKDPTDPNAADVTGIAPPAQPQAVPAAPSASEAQSGIAPVSSVQTPQNLPDLQDAGVASRVAQLTSEDSPTMLAARTAGMQYANSRGLVNSSIGAGAAENEAIKAALPIAQQEASQAFQNNTQRYDLAAQMDRLRAQAGFESQARAENYGYSAALNTQSYQYQAQQQQNQNQFAKDMAAVQQGYAIDTANLNATLQSKLQSQANNEQIQRMGVDLANQLQLQEKQASSALAQIAAQGDVQLKLQANQFQEALKELSLTLNEQNSIAMANAAVNLFQAEAGLRASLLQNENMPAAERAAYEQQISQLTAPTRSYISAVLGYVPQASASAPVAAQEPVPAYTPPTYTPPAYVAPSYNGGDYGGIAPIDYGGGGGGLADRQYLRAL
jgi:hypothetical protein